MSACRRELTVQEKLACAEEQLFRAWMALDDVRDVDARRLGREGRELHDRIGRFLRRRHPDAWRAAIAAAYRAEQDAR